jgi:SPP1 family predicted phage head-tail adaptor
MQAGQLNKTIVLQRRDMQRDSHGAQVPNWSDVAQMRAAIVPLSGRQALVAQAFNAQLTHQILVRYTHRFADPLELPKMRIVWGTRIFNIHAAMNEDESNRQVTLMVFEGMNDG